MELLYYAVETLLDLKLKIILTASNSSYSRATSIIVQIKWQNKNTVCIPVLQS